MIWTHGFRWRGLGRHSRDGQQREAFHDSQRCFS
jgi:hypothetical protein